jgi:hypothetical protein
MALLHTKIPTHPLHRPAFWPIGDGRKKCKLARIWVGTALRIKTATLPHVAVLL